MEEKKTFEKDRVEMTDLGPYPFDSNQLDQIEGDGVNIQCINSSEFVVGRQTNFNGPVTIINCANGSPTVRIPEKTSELEKIVIKDKVLSESAAATINKYAEKKLDESKPKIYCFEKGAIELEKAKRRLKIDFFKIPIFVWIIFLAILVGVVIYFGFVFMPPKNGESSEGKIVSTCQSYTAENGTFCVYSNFDGEGWRGITDFQFQKAAKHVVIAQTKANTCFDVSYCVTLVESYHLNAFNLTSLGFCHFFVGADGNFYENPGKHLNQYLSVNRTVNICFLGNFTYLIYPTYPQVRAVRNFISFGVENNLLTKDYDVLAALSIVNSEDEYSLYKIIKKWPKFKSDVIWIEDGPSENITASKDLKIYRKADWKGAPAISSVEMKLPVPYVVISHSVTPQCFDPNSCSPLIRSMQNYHLSKSFADISYNFLVDSSGNIYEGRGWKHRNIHAGFVNGRNIGINFIGDYSVDIKPTENQFEGVKRLIQYGVENGKISQNYSLVAANSTYNTLSPGKNVYAVIKTWPHFDPNPKAHVKDFDDS